jgi:hypothetical protein
MCHVKCEENDRSNIQMNSCEKKFIIKKYVEKGKISKEKHK